MPTAGVVPDPTAEQLADIAISYGGKSSQVGQVKNRVLRWLSFSTKGSASHPSVEKSTEGKLQSQK